MLRASVDVVSASPLTVEAAETVRRLEREDFCFPDLDPAWSRPRDVTAPSRSSPGLPRNRHSCVARAATIALARLSRFPIARPPGPGGDTYGHVACRSTKTWRW